MFENLADLTVLVDTVSTNPATNTVDFINTQESNNRPIPTKIRTLEHTTYLHMGTTMDMTM
jgi:hypothetical protein